MSEKIITQLFLKINSFWISSYLSAILTIWLSFLKHLNSTAAAMASSIGHQGDHRILIILIFIVFSPGCI